MNEENKKTIVFFIAGLLIGGLLVFIFGIPSDKPANESTDRRNDESVKTIPSSETKEVVDTEATSEEVANEDTEVVETRPVADKAALEDVEFPAASGWVGIRDFENDQLTGLLGVARWSTEENLIPTEVPLLRAMVKGHTYAIVFYKDNGDKRFDLATDAQMDASVVSFVAE